MYATVHRRLNPLTNEWVLVSPQRTNRPWLGHIEKQKRIQIPHHDPNCSLCPGNTRASGIKNPHYTSTFVFDNDFPALVPNTTTKSMKDVHPLLRAEPEKGKSRVVCFSPRHDLTIPDMTVRELNAVITTWTSETEKLRKRSDVCYVQIFENKGEMMGCSNPHPHSQIWTTSKLPNEPSKELVTQSDYLKKNKRPLLLDYVTFERKIKERIVAENKQWVALVPFWAIWPFEIMIIPTQQISKLSECSPTSRNGLVEIMLEVTRRYDRLFDISFPYSMGFHQVPFDGKAHPEWILHAHYYPPLLRSATIRKFMVGFEMLSMPQRDITPEISANVLRSIRL
jgi:UDPglucose--hexose-1-phosphate uridylyltransferase